VSFLKSQLDGAAATSESVSAVLTKIDFDQLRIQATAPRPMILFVRSTLFRGWTATVNGQPTQIIPALGAFTAVMVPTGTSNVSLHFFPTSFAAGLALAYLAFAVVVVVCLIFKWQGPETIMSAESRR
jgi:uncharacterized membrane protein YfhO